MAELGSLLNPRTDPIPIPKSSVSTTIDGRPAIGKQEGRLQRLFSNPAMQAFLMQMASGLLASRGLGPSASQGFGAMGRYAVAQEAERQRQEQLQLNKQQAARQGSGSGGADSKLISKYFQSLLKTQEGAFDEDKRSEVVLRGEATMLAQLEKGDPTAWENYQKLPDGPAKEAYAKAYAVGKEAGDAFVRKVLEQGRTPAAQEEVTQSAPQETPEQSTPQVATPDAAPIATPSTPTIPKAKTTVPMSNAELQDEINNLQSEIDIFTKSGRAYLALPFIARRDALMQQMRK